MNLKFISGCQSIILMHFTDRLGSMTDKYYIYTYIIINIEIAVHPRHKRN